jgi:hypothetical protein
VLVVTDDATTYTSAQRLYYQPRSCPSCGRIRVIHWIDVSKLADTDSWRARERCDNQLCGQYGVFVDG